MENRKMNWDTQELYLWITNEENYYNFMTEHSRTAKEFKHFAKRRLSWINERIGNENRCINENEIQWNELYLSFCEDIGNEHLKMNL